MTSVFPLHGESATRYKGCLSRTAFQARNLCQFYFGIDFHENGSFIAIELPRQAVSFPLTWTLGRLQCSWPFL